MKTVRCAIYTRKSSDEGLEQSFNSLDAQREACSAYILSQASEGWVEAPELYDDGGLSGGTLERPALQRLLSNVRAGRVDIIVVYKVDRLTRSLFDFAKLVELLDAAKTSFVSVTQSFNTTTSMGRLTLNMLLSFAQFEREVTAERIRDKLAASKARGMWMGGVPPLGYAPDGRTLKVVDDHAMLVRDIFERYLALGNVRRLEEQLARAGVKVPRRTLTNGKPIGGGLFSRGQLYLILKRRLYLGEIEHKGAIYPGLHDGIIDRELWDRVQARLADNLQGSRDEPYSETISLLAGKLVDEAGEPLIATHARKGKVRYRYYVSRALQRRDADRGWRLPAREIETLVREQLISALDDPLQLAETAGLDLAITDYRHLTEQVQLLAARLRASPELFAHMVDRVTIAQGRVTITCSSAALHAALELGSAQVLGTTFELLANCRLTRSGRAMRLIDGNGASATTGIDAPLVRLIAQGHRYWAELKRQQVGVTELAAREGCTRSYLTRVMRLAFLSPQVVDAVLSGKQRTSVTSDSVTLPGAVVPSWQEQAAALLHTGSPATATLRPEDGC
jgi:site-specific DNA recombinase